MQLRHLQSTHSSTLSSGDLSSVAARIQDRVNQLDNLEEALEQSRNELVDAEQEFEQADQVRCSLRQSLLILQQERDRIELEQLQRRDRARETRLEIEAIENEVTESTTVLKQSKNSYATAEQSIIVQHDSFVEIYTKILQDQVDRMEKEQQNQLDQLQDVERLSEEVKTQMKSLDQAIEHTKTRLDQEEVRDSENDAEIQQLAKDVRAALFKRSQLRRSLRETETMSSSN